MTYAEIRSHLLTDWSKHGVQLPLDALKQEEEGEAGNGQTSNP